MFGRKNIVISGTILLVITIGGAFLVNNSTPTINEVSLLEKYQQLQKNAQQQATQNCNNPKEFAQQTKDLENRFDKLRQQKHDLTAKANTDEYIPPIPGSEAPENIGPAESEPEANTDEYIPPIPGSEAPENIGPAESKPETNTDEYIPPIPGSEAPENIGPAGSKPETNTDEYIPPIPGSEALDFDLGKTTLTQQIQNIELDIKDILNLLKTKCKKKTPSNDCEKACRNYNNKCLSLVPNLNQKMLDDGFSSCIDLCKKRNKEKIQCIENVRNCESMTEICGL